MFCFLICVLCVDYLNCCRHLVWILYVGNYICCENIIILISPVLLHITEITLTFWLRRFNRITPGSGFYAAIFTSKRKMKNLWCGFTGQTFLLIKQLKLYKSMNIYCFNNIFLPELFISPFDLHALRYKSVEN